MALPEETSVGGSQGAREPRPSPFRLVCHPLRHQATSSWMPSCYGLIPDSQNLPHAFTLSLSAVA